MEKYNIIIQDNTVNLWTNNKEWNNTEISRFESSVVKINWDNNKHTIGISTEDVTLWIYKEVEQGKWKECTVTNSEGYLEIANKIISKHT